MTVQGMTVNEFYIVLFKILLLIIIFYLGIKLFAFYLKRKKWDAPYINALILIIPWFIIDLNIGILFSLYYAENIFIEILLIAIKIIVGVLFIAIFYRKNLIRSILYITFIQAILFGILLSLEGILFLFKLPEFNIKYSEGSVLLYIIFFIVIMSITIFYSYWGHKINFVAQKNEIALFSTIPGTLYLNYIFITQVENFFSRGFSSFLIAILLSIITSFITKKISYKNISLKKLRKLTIHEKDQDLLRIKDLKVYYPLLGGVLKRQIGSVKAVDGISISIKTGETVGLVGESGCGKTTVANAILGLGPKEAGDIIFHGKPMPKYYSTELRHKIQMVFQDPDASLNPRMKIVDIIADPLKNLMGITKKDEIRRHVLKLIEQVALKREHMDRFPHEFSGGQKQRIVIARALASNPELIILDEPTSALDVSVQAQILNILKRLQKTYNFGFLFITHNLAVVNHIADRVAVMYLGKIVEIGDTDQIFFNPSHPYTQALLASRTEIDTGPEIRFVLKGEVPSPINPPSGCYFNPRCSSDTRTPECEYKVPHKITIEEGHYIWCINPPVSKKIVNN